MLIRVSTIRRATESASGYRCLKFSRTILSRALVANDFREDFALMKPRFNAVRILMGETQPSRRANNPPSETREARAFSLSLSISLSLSLSTS